MSMIDSEVFSGRRGVKYVGQYKPVTPYSFAGNLVICPAERSAFPYGPQGGEIYLNISYLVGPDEMTNEVLETTYREWLIFDSFILNDHYPILFYDDNRAGKLETVPFRSGGKQDSEQLDYKQINYANMGDFLSLTSPAKECLPVISYSELYDRYQQVPRSIKDMIEWYVSTPNRPFTRYRAFSNIAYSQIIHMVILLETLIDKSPTCPSALAPCGICGYKPQPHPRMRRKKWLQTYLCSKITDDKIVEEYISIIEAGQVLRNKNVHVPTFDRSSLREIPSGQTHTYGIDRAVQEYKDDIYALESLSVSIRTVARYILLNNAFGVAHFPKLNPLKVTCVSSNVGSGEQ